MLERRCGKGWARGSIAKSQLIPVEIMRRAARIGREIVS